MDVSELRKRILRALDEARKEASTRRQAVDAAAKAYETFLSDVAVPVVRQAAQVLNATGESFGVHTPAGSVRLVSDKSAQTYVEFVLDTAASDGTVVGRVSLARGRQGVVVAERPVAPDKAVVDLTEEDVSAFLVAEVPKLIVKT
jgi:hypothetical protein